MVYHGENQKIPSSSAGSLRLPVDCTAFQPFRPLCLLSPLLLPDAMAAQQIMESEVRRLTQELHAKDAGLRAKDVEPRELKEERTDMLLRNVREFMELQKRQALTTKDARGVNGVVAESGRYGRLSGEAAGVRVVRS